MVMNLSNTFIKQMSCSYCKFLCVCVFDAYFVELKENHRSLMTDVLLSLHLLSRRAKVTVAFLQQSTQ